MNKLVDQSGPSDTLAGALERSAKLRDAIASLDNEEANEQSTIIEVHCQIHSQTSTTTKTTTRIRDGQNA